MASRPFPAGARIAPIPAGVPLEIISTDSVIISERREFWQSGSSFLFGMLQMEQHGREPFDAKFSYTRLGDLVFCRLATRVSHRAVRTKAVARRDERPFHRRLQGPLPGASL